MEEEPEWSQPQSCSAKAADEGTTASPEGHQASGGTLWVSLQAPPLTTTMPNTGVPHAVPIDMGTACLTICS